MQRIISSTIGHGSLSASGSETFAHYHTDGQAHGGSGGLLGESSTSSEALAMRLSCNGTTFEDVPDERSNLSLGEPETEESMHSVASKVSERGVSEGEEGILSATNPDSPFEQTKINGGARRHPHGPREPHAHACARLSHSANFHSLV